VTLLAKSLGIRRWLLLGLGIFLFGSRLFALDPSRTIFQYNLQSWTRQNGLPFNRIRSITQTPDGFLWIATQNGLVRFDGTDFARTAIPNHFGWHSQSVLNLTLSSRGGLWFALDGAGFGYYDGTNRFNTVTGAWLTAETDISTIREQTDGTIWMAGRSGLIGLIGGTTNRMFLDNQVSDIIVTYEDPLHRLWLGTDAKGLFYLDGGKVKAFPDTSLAGNVAKSVRAVAVDHQGRIWVGTSAGLHCYDRNFRRDEAFDDNTEVAALLVDKQGTVWAGTTGGGLVRYAGGEISHLRKTNGLAEDYVTALFEDREGSLWVGTRNGLTQISDLKFPTASTAEGLLSDPVLGVSVASNGGIWCATPMGIYNYHDRAIVNIPPPTTNGSLYAKRVFEARDGDLYALAGPREVQIFSGGKFVAAHHFENDWPTALAEDAHGMIVSMGGFLHRVNREGITPFVFPGTAAPDFGWIRNLSLCADGSLLVSSANGAYRIHSDRLEHWTTAEGLLDLDVDCMTEDSEGTIWIGHPTGLSRLKDHKVNSIRGLPADALFYAMIPDDLGNLWINCNAGIIRASRRSLDETADGKISKPQFTLYDGTEAVRTIDMMNIEGVACKTADGKIWLPGALGAVQIDPAHIPSNPVAPPVYIQKVLVNGVQQTAGLATEVRRGNGELAFHYTSVSFVAPQKTRFRYQLEGYDADWVDAGSQRSALYANLKPGKYIFHVQACNVDGVWNNNGATYAVELPPLFYQTAWFKIAVVAAVLLVVFGIYGWRTRFLRQKEKRLQAANELLEKKVRERTREVAEQRNVLRTLIDNLPDAVFVKDTDCRVIIDNKAHARYFGFDDPSQAVGKTDLDCLPHERAGEFRRDELALLKSGKIYDAEEQLTLKTGETIWLRTTKVPLRNERGEIVGLAGINRDISERKKWEAELELLHKQLLETSRHAGMAEVATSVLHNVGNVLNSVNVSASIVDEQTRSPNLERLNKVITLLQENSSDLSRFLTQGDKGTKVISYLEALFVILTKERQTVQGEVEALIKNVEHIKKIVSMQQSYARIAGVVEVIHPTELIDDSLRLHEAAYQRHSIKVIREFAEVPKIGVDRHKVIQILVNLLGNAKYACEVNPPAQRTIQVRLCAHGPEQVRIEVMDNGMGIAAENLTRVFSYGFTTRKNGHGFGLHSGALAAREMGGSLQATSAGAGKGATFILILPLQHKSVTPAPRPVQPSAPAAAIEDDEVVSI